jgi:monofunctional biosynthetic peptidoglycan transglycosylase
MTKSGISDTANAITGGVRRISWPGKAGLGIVALFSLPVVLTIYYTVIPPPYSSVMLQRLLMGESIDYQWVPLAAISPALAKAVVTAEDARFCKHQGIDWPALHEVVAEAMDGDERRIRGASTIAMQTAKNLFLWEGRSLIRKAIEMPLALWIDTVWPKKRVIEVYLNVAEWGPGIYGAEAAARKHFAKHASELSVREAALLASVLPNPVGRQAGRPSAEVRRKANLIERRMLNMGSLLNCLQ